MRGQFSKEPLAPRIEPLPARLLFRRRLERTRARPDAGAQNCDREEKRQIARPRGWCGSPLNVSAQRLSRRNAAPFRDDEHSPCTGMSRCSAICGDSSCMSPTFCAMMLSCCSADRETLLPRQGRAIDRHRKTSLQERRTRRERTVDGQLLAGEHRVSARAFHHAGALRPCRKSTRQRLRWPDGRLRGFTTSSSMKTLSASSPTSKTNRDCGPKTTVPGCAAACAIFCARGVGRDQRHTDPAVRRHREFLRFEPFTVDDGSRLHARPRRKAGELGASRVVRLGLHHGRPAGELDFLVGNDVRHRSADDADRDGAGRKVGDGQRQPRHLLRVWHATWHLR